MWICCFRELFLLLPLALNSVYIKAFCSPNSHWISPRIPNTYKTCIHISAITHLHVDCTAAYQCVFLLCADLWQVGSGGELSLAAVQYGSVFSAVAQVK